MEVILGFRGVELKGLSRGVREGALTLRKYLICFVKTDKNKADCIASTVTLVGRPPVVPPLIVLGKNISHFRPQKAREYHPREHQQIRPNLSFRESKLGPGPKNEPIKM